MEGDAREMAYGGGDMKSIRLSEAWSSRPSFWQFSRLL